MTNHIEQLMKAAGAKQYNEAYETIQRPIPTLNKQILQTLQVQEVE